MVWGLRGRGRDHRFLPGDFCGQGLDLSGTAPDEVAVGAVRRYLHFELALFVLLPIFAAAMARGFGEF